MSQSTQSIPQHVLSEELQRAMQGRRLVTALFTTFSFDPGFFEQEVLRLFFDEEVSHLPVLRTVQMEQALHSLSTRAAVYYDPQALECAARFGPARLDFARHPVRMGACFHPKMVCLLVEAERDEAQAADADPPRELIVACLSANLTESGWWQNVECAHLEVLRSGDRCAFKEDLVAFLKWLAPQSPAAPPAQPGVRFTQRFEGEAAGEIVRFLEQEMGADFLRQSSDTLHARFLWKQPGAALLDTFIDEFSQVLRGMNLEVISPFFSHDDSAAPLDAIIEAMCPPETRVFMPKDDAGTPKVSRSLHDAIRGLENTSWSSLPGEVTRAGNRAQAAARGVHAKLYRFFRARPMREIWVLGSANLTRAAWQKGGNMECLFIVERPCTRRPDFLLQVDSKRPDADATTITDPLETALDESALAAFSLRYDWATQKASARWEGDDPPAGLVLSVSGVALGAVPALRPRGWLTLASELAEKIAAHLHSTSLFTVHDDAGRGTVFLVMEDAVQTHKPSQLERLNAADILRYWALLTADQRNRWLESRLRDLILATSADGETLPANASLPKGAESLFDRVAGFFHAFHHLEQSVGKAMEENRPSLAVARLFGRKHDSLHRLLDRLEQPEDPLQDVVDRYVIALSARQSLKHLRTRHVDLWRDQRPHAEAITLRVEALADKLRGKILSQGESAAFLDWFEKGFLKRAGEVTAS
ncbi:MAG: hypothetical protein IAE77_10315 [Prosthecobacter sp.]|jgi:hypothetical protein|uniref:hypothetical protein n=1 Tax=Prosthecobacter sp. TaxID=1965333 RepID=UPI0019E07EB3|nr:hypothetical protein [Prosthecobacter sp.]MBE2283838.1 hypothetical protein [Prosthecobacter sp.]